MDDFLPTPFIILILALVFIGVPLFFVVLYRAERKAAAQSDSPSSIMPASLQSVEAEKGIPLGVCPKCGKETYHEVDKAQDALSSLPGADSTPLTEGSVVFRCSDCGYTYTFQELQYNTGKEVDRRSRMGCASELKSWLIALGVLGILAAINFLIRGGSGEDPLKQLEAARQRGAARGGRLS